MKFSKNIIDKNAKLFGKYDLFIPLFLIIVLVLGFFITRVLLQKDTYITIEMFASGGEWWWDNPKPPYWITDPIQPGSAEYDPQGNKLVEIIDTRKFQEGDRKMLWVKAKIRVSQPNKSKQYRFRRDPIQIGSLIYISPNNVRINGNVMWIEGVTDKRQEVERVITLKQYDVYPWHTDAIIVGDTMKSDDGTTIVEILDKKVTDAETLTTDDRGFVHVQYNPLKRDITIKVKMKATRSQNLDYFSYFQPLKIGFFLWIPFEKTNFNGNIISMD